MQQPDPAHMQQMIAMMLPMMMLFGIIGSAIIVIPFWVIFKKAGLGAPLSLLMLIPGVGIIMLYVLAFSRWKVMPVPEYGYPPAYPPPGPPSTTPPVVPTNGHVHTAEPIYSPPVYTPGSVGPQTPVPPPDTPPSI